MYYDIDELVAFEVPIHKLMNVDVLLYYRQINVDVTKVLKMRPHF